MKTDQDKLAIARTIIETIEQNIDDIAFGLGWENITELKQSQWKALLFKINAFVFPTGNSILKDDTLHERSGTYPTTFGQYDIEVVDILCDYFIYLSNKYNKLVSIQGFCYLFGIDTETINRWQYESEQTHRNGIYTKLNQYRETSMLDRASDSKNILGLFQVGRRLYNWDSPLQKNERLETLTASELPKLTDDRTQD